MGLRVRKRLLWGWRLHARTNYGRRRYERGQITTCTDWFVINRPASALMPAEQGANSPQTRTNKKSRRTPRMLWRDAWRRKSIGRNELRLITLTLRARRRARAYVALRKYYDKWSKTMKHMRASTRKGP